MVLSRAVFLDKDGTLIPNIPYNVDPKKVSMDSVTIEALQLLSRLGYQLFIISNQSGIARGYFSEWDLVALIQHFFELFESLELQLKGFYWCPHHPEGRPPYNFSCECRKPKPGMVMRAAQDYSINLAESWFIGDILHDVEAGRRAGCRTILLANGGETEWKLSPDRLPHHIVHHLGEAARIIQALHSE